MVAQVTKKRAAKSTKTETVREKMGSRKSETVSVAETDGGANRLGKIRAKKKLAPTFSDKTLEGSFVSYVQMSFPEVRDAAELFLRAKRIAATEIAFIGSPESFQIDSAESDILGQNLLAEMNTEPAKKSAKLADLPVHLARLCETRLLTPEEEKTLFFRMNYLKYKALQLRSLVDISKPDDWLLRRIDGLVKAADWHRDCIVKSNMRLVISIIKKFVNQHNGFDDLLSDGIVAVIRAVDKFDVALGFRFSTYATQVVRRNTYRKVMEKQKERQKNIASLSENGLDFSDDQKESSMSEERWHALRNRLALMLDHLDRREKFIIRARFSLGGHRKVQTLQRLADVLGVSKERIRQLEKRALEKLRGMTEAAPILPDSDI
ncbi:sigma-70 family RNA polymerase sigma factor [Pirellulaceae bacterium SH449]